MFDSLDEQMKQDDKRMESTKEKVMRWVIVAIAALVVFGAVIAGVHMTS